MNKWDTDFGSLTDQEIVDRISSDDYEGGNIMLSPKASLETKTKHRIGKAILTYQLRNKLPDSEIAKKLDTDERSLYDICRGAIKRFSLPTLFSYLEKLTPNYDLLVVSKERGLEYLSD